MKPINTRPSALPLALAISMIAFSARHREAQGQTQAPASAVKVEPNLLPSAVSPAIERFMRENGKNLQVPPRLPVPSPMKGGVDRKPIAPPTADRQSVDQRRDTSIAKASSTAPPSTGGLASSGPSPMEISLKLKAAPLAPTDRRFPINLATALRLSDARPLTVAAAQASAWVAEAQITRANVLWVPAVVIGFDYLRHDGGGPDFNKGIMTSPSVNYFMGGAGANLYVNMTDAIFEPLAARQTLNAANWDIQSAKNDALQQTADAYFRVHQYRGMYAGSIYAVDRGKKLVEKIRNLSMEMVPKDEVDRAQNMLADLQQRAVTARQEWRVASADLTQILRLDPRAVVVPLEHDHVQITLIDPGRTLDDLLPIALTNRPELASRRATIEAAEVKVRREKMRPFLPNVIVSGFQHPGMLLQAGIFGLGANSSLNQFNGREDVSLQLMWQVEGFGIGNMGRIKAQRGNQSRAIVDYRNTQDMVAADVTRAQARLQSAAARVLQADRSLRTGIITFNGHLEGLEQTRRFGNLLVLTFRPQEAVYSLQLLNVAFNEYFTTVADYNRAQFELFHALGYPGRELAQLQLPGDIQPADTSRPAYLPQVGEGPPPATR